LLKKYLYSKNDPKKNSGNREGEQPGAAESGSSAISTGLLKRRRHPKKQVLP